MIVRQIVISILGDKERKLMHKHRLTFHQHSTAACRRKCPLQKLFRRWQKAWYCWQFKALLYKQNQIIRWGYENCLCLGGEFCQFGLGINLFLIRQDIPPQACNAWFFSSIYWASFMIYSYPLGFSPNFRIHSIYEMAFQYGIWNLSERGC